MQKLLLISVLLSFYASALPVGAQDVDSLIKDAEAISKLSEQLFVSGQFDEALKYANKELSLRERIGDSKYIGSANFNLGVIYREKRQLDKALKHMETAINHYRNGYGPVHQKVYLTLKLTARILLLKNEKAKAVQAVSSAIEIAQKLNGPVSQEVAELTLALARIYEEMKRPEDAETAYYLAILTRDELERSVNDFDREDVDAFMCFSLNIEFFRDFDSENKKLAKKRAEKRKDSIVWLGVLNSRGAKLANPEVRYGVLESLLRPFTVPIRVLVDKSGRVSQAKSICVVPPNLAEPALTAAYKSAFAPFVKDGEPVESAGLIVYVFGR